MYELVILILNICLFKKGPEDLPYSYNLFRLLLIIAAGINFLMLVMQTNGLSALMQTLVALVLICVFSGFILYLFGKPARFYQTTCALLGTDALINFLALPAVATMTLEQGGLLVLLVFIGLIVWHWAITGHIISNALEKNLSFGLGVAFLYLFASYQVMALLFPEISGVN